MKDPSFWQSFKAFINLKLVVLVSVVITGLGPDFTRMESFGKVEEFADTLVGFLIIYILQFLEMETQFSFYMLHSA